MKGTVGCSQGTSGLTASPLFLQAMRFPPKSYNKDLESAEVSSAPGRALGALLGSCWTQLLSPACPHLLAFAFQERREREQQDLEFAKEMAEDDDDGFP